MEYQRLFVVHCVFIISSAAQLHVIHIITSHVHAHGVMACNSHIKHVTLSANITVCVTQHHGIHWSIFDSAMGGRSQGKPVAIFLMQVPGKLDVHATSRGGCRDLSSHVIVGSCHLILFIVRGHSYFLNNVNQKLSLSAGC